MTTDDIRIGTDEGDTCNRLGCDGMMFDDYPYETVICALCGYGHPTQQWFQHYPGGQSCPGWIEKE